MIDFNSNFWRRYRQNKTAWIATWLFLLLMIIAGAANIVANDRPLIMSYKGKLYAPVLFDYLPYEFGKDPAEIGYVVDYLAFEKEINANGWAIFPPIKQRPYDPNLNFESLPAPPGSTSVVSKSDTYDGMTVVHRLGTDTAGRDLITRLIYGVRTSLGMSIAITLISLVLGVLLGAAMGYLGGVFDMLVGRLLETLGYFPVIFMIIILVAFLENPSLTAVSIIFAILGLAPFAFYTRGQVLQARKLTYVEAAVALGQKQTHIMVRHILPNALSPILVLIPFTITANISFLATIDFLGFGVQPPTASLGAILRSGFEDIENRSWLVLYSSLVLIAILLLVNFIGDGVRDGMDPHATLSRKEFSKWLKTLKAGKALKN